MKDALAIFRFLDDCVTRGEPSALVTLTGVVGSSARAVGTHMAVSRSGGAAGSFSGGCIEAAVIAEAQDAMDAGDARAVRFGAGSPYIDVRLPCGGGIDLSFIPGPSSAAIRQACDSLEGRRPLTIELTIDGRMKPRSSGALDRTGWDGDSFIVRHAPGLRLVVLGNGAEPGSLLRLARAYGAETLLLSPDRVCIDEAGRLGSAAGLLRFPRRSDLLQADAYTAVVFLFHDHDWEPELLAQALEQGPLFVGAMGSRRTHAERCATLADLNVPKSEIDGLIGPIGLLKAARDPDTLAVSVLAQIVEAYEHTVSPPSPLGEGGRRTGP